MAYIFKKQNIKMTTFMVIFKAGSIYEEEGKYGTMHLMEHLHCKSFDDLRDKFTQYGIEYNAFTDEEYVCFYFSGLSSKLTSDFKIELYNRIVGSMSYLTKENFENERKTVVQEYLDYTNSPKNTAYLNFCRQFFKNYSVIGKKEDIENFTIEDAYSTHDKYFSNPYKIVEIGPNKTDFFEQVIYGGVDLKIKEHTKKIEPLSVNNPDKKYVFVKVKHKITKKDYKYYSILNKVLNEGLQAPFYQEIREKRGLSYYSAGEPICFGDYCYATFTSCTNNDRVEELVNVYKEIFSDIEKYITKERFDIIVEKVKCIQEKKKIVPYQYGFNMISDNWTLPKKVDTIKYEKLLEWAKKYYTLNNIEIVWF